MYIVKVYVIARYKYLMNTFVYSISFSLVHANSGFVVFSLGGGQSHPSGANGGSHGSRGGQGASLTSVAMATRDIYSAGLWGSGGGSSGSYDGGRGGGYLHINSPNLIMSGVLLCNGDNAEVGKTNEKRTHMFQKNLES